jgi:transcriptional regulator with XRE-family HTH domain
VVKFTASIGENLRKAIRGSRRTYAKAAEDLGISLSFLNQLMDDQKNPSLETVRGICEKLQISASDLLEVESGQKALKETLEKQTKVMIDQSELQVQLHKRIQELEDELKKAASISIPPELWAGWRKAEKAKWRQWVALFFLTSEVAYLRKKEVPAELRKRLLAGLRFHKMDPNQKNDDPDQ